MVASSRPPARTSCTAPRSTVRGPSCRGATSSRLICSTAADSEPSTSAIAPISSTLPLPRNSLPSPTRACSRACSGTRSSPISAVASSASGASSARSGASPGASVASRAGLTGASCTCTAALRPPAGSVARAVARRRSSPSARVSPASAVAPPRSWRSTSSPTWPARQVAPSARSSTVSVASRMCSRRICAQGERSVPSSPSTGRASWRSSAGSSRVPAPATAGPG